MSQDAIVQCDCCGGVVSPKSAKPESRVAELTDALTGMVRLHCTDNGVILAEHVESVEAVCALVRVGAVEVLKDGGSWMEAKWLS